MFANTMFVLLMVLWRGGAGWQLRESAAPLPLPVTFPPPTLLSVGDSTDSLGKLPQCYLQFPVGGWDGRLPVFPSMQPPVLVLESVSASLAFITSPTAD